MITVTAMRLESQDKPNPMFAEKRSGTPRRPRGAAPGAEQGDKTGQSDTAPDDEPSSQAAPPYVTFCVLAVITAFFLAMLQAGHGDVTSVCVAFGAKDNTLIHQGQFWRLVTPIFLHASWPHLLVNGFSLYRLGGSMERIYGARKYFIVFMAAGIAGNALSYQLSPTWSLGASGALAGLVGAGLVFPIRFRHLLPAEVRSSILRQLTLVVVVNLGIGFSLRGIIDNWAHLGGLLGGAFAALFLIPEVLEPEAGSRAADRLVTALALLSAGLVVGSWALQWRWSRQNPSVPLVAYLPMESSWWTIAVPATWRRTDGVWRGPDGATIAVTDRPLTDPEVQRTLQSIVKSGEKANTDLDGRPGWYVPTKSRIAYRIPCFDRLFELTLEGSRYPLSSTATRDFAIAAGTVRFIRPPTAPNVPRSAP